MLYAYLGPVRQFEEWGKMWLLWTKDESILFYIGETKGQYAEGFWISRNMRNKIIKIKGISERITLLKLEFKEGLKLMQ